MKIHCNLALNVQQSCSTSHVQRQKEKRKDGETERESENIPRVSETVFAADVIRLEIALSSFENVPVKINIFITDVS